jgi:FlaA1/EpsC-like NDP-sugar epimerase
MFLDLLNRSESLFQKDILDNEVELLKIIQKSSFLILGGAGSIGQAVVKEVFKRNPRKLHVVDLSENNLTELVRDIRSSFGYIKGDFQTYAIDIGSIEYDAFINSDGKYDYVMNLSALKHVRSEKDPYTLMRMIDVNILNTLKTLNQSIKLGVKKYFCVSSDKATNPVNMMGASKRIMELYLMNKSLEIEVSTARFANVAFSDGSLLHGFNQRIQKKQPIVAPSDIRRYFFTPQESGELCLMSCIFGSNRDIFFPKFNSSLHLINFTELVLKYLNLKGYQPYICKNENEARSVAKNIPQGKWPCLFTTSDTTGEKDFEEFFTDKEVLDMSCFENVGIIKNVADYDVVKLNKFVSSINAMKSEMKWDKKQLVELFVHMVPDFAHKETGRYLDGKM